MCVCARVCMFTTYNAQGMYGNRTSGTQMWICRIFTTYYSLNVLAVRWINAGLNACGVFVVINRYIAGKGSLLAAKRTVPRRLMYVTTACVLLLYYVLYTAHDIICATRGRKILITKLRIPPGTLSSRSPSPSRSYRQVSRLHHRRRRAARYRKYIIM